MRIRAITSTIFLILSIFVPLSLHAQVDSILLGNVYTIEIPASSSLIGWYKVNEGSGTTVVNYGTAASPLPNLTVINTQGNFWTAKAGFGSTTRVNGPPYARAYAVGDNGSTRTYGGSVNGFACYGMFFYRTVADGGTGGAPFSLFQYNTDSSAYGTEFNRTDTITFSWLGGLSTTVASSLVINTWNFIFVDSAKKVSLVRPDGTRIQGTSIVNMNSNVSPRYVHIGVRFDDGVDGYYGAGGSYGDFIIYHGALLTDTQWAVWYDNLRSRYGMSARSGW